MTRGKFINKIVFISLFFLIGPSPAFAALQAVPGTNSPSNQRDKYQTDLFTGAASYNYPITVPPGTNGLTPTVSLSYSSLGANDLSMSAGVGWQLNRDYIERDTHYTPGDSNDDTFKLHFQGISYDLVYVSSEDRYHTKIESYLNISKVPSGGANSSGEYWLVTTKDGTKYRFGYQQDSELLCEGRGFGRFWNLDLVEDIHGNHIYYTYIEDNGVSYLSKIEYNNDKQRTVEFVYENNPYQRTVYPQGCRTLETFRLGSIQVKAAGNLVHRFVLAYTQSGNYQSLTSSITESGKDGSSLPATTFSYNSQIKNWNIQFETWVNNAPIDVSLDQVDARLIDVTGDGLPDIVKTISDGGRNTWRVWRNTGNSWKTDYETWVNNAPIDVSLDQVDARLIDTNGDGLADIVKSIQINGGIVTWRVWLNTGNSWNTQSSDWLNRADIDAHLQQSDVRLVDVTGDGLPDIVKGIHVNGGWVTWRVWRNTGSSWNTQYETWINNADIDVYLDQPEVRIVDVNGDGLSDIVKSIQINGGIVSWRVWLNTGNSWNTQSSDWLNRADIDAHLQQVDTTLADVNGDNLPDVIKVIANGGNVTWKVLLNTGNSWRTDFEIWINNAGIDVNVSTSEVRLVDVNGDNLLDIVKTVSDGGRNTWKVWKNNGYGPNLLSVIHTPQGGSISFGYTGISDLPFPLWTVQKMTGNNGMGGDHGTSDSTTYSYSNGLYNYQDKEYRGFGEVLVIDPKNTITHYWFHQDDARKGKVYRTETKDSQGNLYTKLELAWSNSQNNGLYNAQLTQEKKYTYDGATDNPKTTQVDYLYDNYGNITKTSQQGDTSITGDEHFSYSEYVYNPTLWIVDRKKHVFLQDFDDSTKLSESFFYYDSHSGLDDTLAKGDLTREEKWSEAGQSPITLYEYDSFGNRTKITDANNHTTQYVFGINDQTFTYPGRMINAKNQQSNFVYDLGTGNMLSKTDLNGFATSYEYDVFGRVIKEIQPYDSSNLPTVTYQYLFDGIAPEGTLVSKREASGAAGTLDTYTFIDGLGRTIQTRAEAEDATKQIVIDSFYNSIGLIDRQTVPHLDVISQTYAPPLTEIRSTITNYDPIGRVITVVNPNSTSKTIGYDHWSVATTNENGDKTKQHLDAYEKIIQVDEENGGATYNTTYKYNGRNDLTKITDVAGNSIDYVYDSLGRKKSQTDPDLGTWRYEYDLVGNLIKQTDNRGTVVNNLYDELNRIVKVDYPTDTDVTYIYDTDKIGTLSEVNDAGGKVKYLYDQRLRKIQEQRIIEGTVWTTQIAYDALNRTVSRTNPDGETVSYSFNPQGEVNQVNGIVKNIDYNAQGKIVKKEYENSVNTEYTYNIDDFRLNRILTANLQDINYTYDNVGNIKTIKNNLLNTTQNFGYDNLNRLTTAQESGKYDFAYEYNTIGNLMKFTNSGKPIDYTYGQDAGVHALTSSTEEIPTPTPSPTPTPTPTSTPTPTPTSVSTPTPTPTLMPTPTPTSGKTNIAPNGAAYRWSKNTSATANTNRVAAVRINDLNMTQDVPLNGGLNDISNAWEGAGVIWATAQNNVSSVEYTNGSYTLGSGVFTKNFRLQVSSNGTTWANTAWSCTPSYAYDSSGAAGKTYTCSGTAVSVKGIRIVGQVNTILKKSKYANAKELKVFTINGSTPTPTATPTSTQTPTPTQTPIPSLPTPTVTPTPTPTPTSSVARPDLIITRIVLSAPNPQVNQFFDLTVYFKNQGTVSTSSPSTVKVGIYYDLASSPTTATPTSASATYLFTIPPGQEVSVKKTFQRFTTVGSHRVWALVDQSKYITESNEENNAFGPLNVTVSP